MDILKSVYATIESESGTTELVDAELDLNDPDENIDVLDDAVPGGEDEEDAEDNDVGEEEFPDVDDFLTADAEDAPLPLVTDFHLLEEDGEVDSDTDEDTISDADGVVESVTNILMGVALESDEDDGDDLPDDDPDDDEIGALTGEDDELDLDD